MLRNWVFSLLISAFGITVPATAGDTCLTYTTLGISFPPVSDDADRQFSQQRLNDLGVKKIRFAESWALREPQKGNANWKPLDDRIAWANSHGYDVLLTIQATGPSWACAGAKNKQSCVVSLPDFTAYVTTLAKRYSGKIAKIQFGNEWQSDYWYAGTAAEFIQTHNIVYDAVHEYMPSTTVVLGGFTTMSLRFMAACNGRVQSFYDDEGVLYDQKVFDEVCSSEEFKKAYSRIDSVLTLARYDEADIHLYDDAEQWGEYYGNFLTIVDKPVIVTEFGGPNMNVEPYTEEYQAQRLKRYIMTLDSLRIREAYFFKLVEGSSNPTHVTSGLVNSTTLALKPAYTVFRKFSVCKPLNVVQDRQSRAPRLSPNPATGQVVITADNCGLSGHSIQVYNNLGVRVIGANASGTEQYVMDISTLGSGMYSVVLSGVSGPVWVGSLLVQ